jgi:hypothetical protein
MKSREATIEPPILRNALFPEMAELSLLLPQWQMQKLADLAHTQGVTVGELLRGLIARLVPRIPATTAN